MWRETYLFTSFLQLEDEGVEENKSSMIIKENDYVKQSRVINL